MRMSKLKIAALRRTLPLLAVIALGIGALPITAQEAAASRPVIGSFGFDVAGMDRAVAPGDDFYRYANGAWLDRTVIPDDRSNENPFHQLAELSRVRTRALLEEEVAKPGSQIGAFYASFMDEAGAEAKGLAPLTPELAAISAAADKSALAALMATLQRRGAAGLTEVEIAPDDKDPSTYIARLHQSGLGISGRDYYVKDDAKLVETRAAYGRYLAELLTLSGQANAAERAACVLAFEIRLATAHVPRAESRDADKGYNKWRAAELSARAPGLDWPRYLDALGLSGQPALLVTEPGALAGEAQAWAETPLATLKDWLALRLLTYNAGYLPASFVKADFAFSGTALRGTSQDQPRWRKGVTLVSGAMGEAVGEIYVARYFSPATKARTEALVATMFDAYRQHIGKAEWMAPESRRQALAKLDNFQVKIGYPDHWRDYTGLVMRPDDLVGNVARAAAFEYQRNLNKLGRPVDRDEWMFPPMATNGWAVRKLNEIFFPAALLQAPMFDPDADPAVNYGGIGVVIGHEISHQFDAQGRKYDPSGRLADWWTPADVQHFTAMAEKLARQYDAYEPLPGLHVNGDQTLDENLADLTGLVVSHDAYVASLGGHPAPVLQGFSGEQRFFLSYAQISRLKERESELRQDLLSDDHSPDPLRVAEMRNLESWYAAFAVTPAQAQYLPPDQRVRIW